jgi:hypothetical protein
MAINNTNVALNSLGESLASTYIRIATKGRLDGSFDILFYVYKDKASFLAGGLPIQDFLDLDFEHFNTGVLAPADSGIDNLHDLAITELVARGLDASKLAKTDLV